MVGDAMVLAGEETAVDSGQGGRQITGWIKRALPAPLLVALREALPSFLKTSIRSALASPWLSGVERALSRRATNRVKAESGSVAPAALQADLARLPLSDRAVVVVYSSLSALGFVEGGAATVVDALINDVVRDRGGTLVLPTFSIAGTMAEHLRGGHVFDVRTTPSGVGAITEVFRQRPGVLRSVHPTHSVAALGPRGTWLTE